ncbi:MAG: UbiA family prenyltransferase [Methanomassiliicoccales archaeon]
MTPYLSIIRYRNCVTSAVAVLLGALVATGSSFLHHIIQTVLAMVVVFLFTGAGNTLNDYLDRDIDKTAHPDRSIPSGRMKPAAARLYASVLFALSVLLTFPLGLYPLAIVFLSLAIMLLYEFKMKSLGLGGNLSIAWLTASLFLFGAVSTGHVLPIWAFFVTSFLATLGREVIKDIEDMDADKGKRRTLPLSIGKSKSMWVSAIGFAGAIVVSPFPFIIHQFGLGYLFIVAAADIIFIYSGILQITDAHKAQNVCKYAMYVALLAFLAGAAGG